MRERRVDADVLVVGSGIAGLSAALSAVERGAPSVLVAEADKVIGGSTRLSGGFLLGAGTRFQRAAGIVDSAEAFFYEYMLLNRWTIDAGLARTFTDGACKAIEWLADLGLEFHEELVVAGDEPTWRAHAAIGGGQAIIDVLRRRCQERGVDFALDRRVDHLLTEGGAVIGATVGTDTVEAGAVILASGGFGANEKLVREHYPSAYHPGWTWYIGSRFVRGDALTFAEAVDARVVGYDRGLRTLHGNFSRDAEGLLPGWLVLVNRDGDRVVNEMAPYGMLDSVARANNDELYAILDHATVERAQVGVPAPRRRHAPGAPRQHSPHWNHDTILQRVSDGQLTTAPSIESLAGTLGLPGDALRNTVDRYNQSCAAGHDAEQLKPGDCLWPVASPPFYGAKLVPAAIGITATGLRIDRDARVIRRSGEPVPGLYAAGECTGGVLGDQYYGSGNSLSNGAVFGRIAGRSAVRA